MKAYNGRVNNSNELLANYFESHPKEQFTVVELSRRLPQLTEGSIGALLSLAFNNNGFIKGTEVQVSRTRPIGVPYVYRLATGGPTK